MDLLGAHVSVAGGPHTAFERGEAIGCNSLQIFVKSPNRWKGAKLDAPKIGKFREAREAAPQPVIAHAAYLINLCGTNEELIEKSRAALIDELQRCHALGVDALVVHPGAHLGEGVQAGVEGIARSLDIILGETPDVSTRLLLENTAGQGSAMGRSFDELGGVIDLVDQKERLGICLDTCHAYAAGYDLVSESGFREMLDVIDGALGLNRVEALHLNDSKHPLGSNKDRHDNIGEGEIGMETFVRIVHAGEFEGRPMVLETPLGDDDLGHQRDLRRLREAAGLPTG